MTFLVELLFSALFELVFYAIGRVLIPILSLGTARVETLGEFKPRRCHTFGEHRDGKLVVTDTYAMLVGLLFVVAMCALAFALLR